MKPDHEHSKSPHPHSDKPNRDPPARDPPAPAPPARDPPARDPPAREPPIRQQTTTVSPPPSTTPRPVTPAPYTEHHDYYYQPPSVHEYEHDHEHQNEHEDQHYHQLIDFNEPLHPYSDSHIPSNDIFSDPINHNYRSEDDTENVGSSLYGPTGPSAMDYSAPSATCPQNVASGCVPVAQFVPCVSQSYPYGIELEPYVGSSYDAQPESLPFERDDVDTRPESIPSQKSEPEEVEDDTTKAKPAAPIGQTIPLLPIVPPAQIAAKTQPMQQPIESHPIDMATKEKQLPNQNTRKSPTERKMEEMRKMAQKMNGLVPQQPMPMKTNPQKILPLEQLKA